MNKQSSENKTRVRKTMDLGEIKIIEIDEKKRIIYYPFLVCFENFLIKFCTKVSVDYLAFYCISRCSVDL